MNATATTTGRSRSMFRIWKYGVSFLIFAGGIGAAVWLAYQKEKPKNRESITQKLQVDTEGAFLYTGNIEIQVNGVVVPHKEIKLASEVAGRIVEKTDKCQAGQLVKKGQLLFRINPVDYENDLAQAVAELQQAENSLSEKEGELENAKTTKDLAIEDFNSQVKEFESREKLWKQEAISESEFLQAKMNKSNAEQAKIRAENALASLKQNIARLGQAKTSAEKRRDKAQLNLDRCRIEAPIDGIIVRDIGEEGDFVQRGTQVALIEDYEKVEVQCNLRPDQIQWLWENSPPEAKVDKGPSELDSSTLGPSPKQPTSVEPELNSSENGGLTQDEVNMNLSAFRLPRIPVEIVSNFGADDKQFVWKGTLESYDGIQLDEMTKMVPCRIVVEKRVVNRSNKNGVHEALGTDRRALLRGMFAKAKISLSIDNKDSAAPKFVSFPAVAVQPGNYVWTTYPAKVEKEDKDGNKKMVDVNLLNRHEVKIAYRYPTPKDSNKRFDKYVVVRIDPTDDGKSPSKRSGIMPGDKIVLTPMAQPEINKTEVELRELTEKAEK